MGRVKLKGKMVLELTDEATGEVESITEENMVTEAVNDILGMNPMGVFYSEERLADVLAWNGTLLPICPNMIGGILLFPKALEEDAAHIYESSGNLPVAYASNNVNTTADTARGSLNQSESKALENGYKFVWEFTPSQGNGTIAAVALTSAQGGQGGYGSLVGDAGAFLQIKKLDIGSLGNAEQAVLFEAVEMDFEKDLLYSVAFEDSSVRVRKVRIPIFSIGLNEKMDDSTYTVLEDHAVQVENFQFLGSYTKYGEFLDGQDGYWYGFSNEANSSGNARLLWVKVSKEGYSMTEGEWTLSNAKLMAVGERNMTGSSPERKCRCCMRGGYLYVPANDKKGIYKINMSNSADVSLIDFGFTSKMKPLCDSGTCELYLALVGDLIVGGDFQVTVDDKVVQTQGSARLGSAATPLFQYKQFLVGWGGSYGNEYRYMYLLTPYLATINNLSSAVVKDANKTMKITYTLTEEP